MPKAVTIISVVLIGLALLSFITGTFGFSSGSGPGVSDSTLSPPEETLPENQTITLDENIMLVQQSHGAAYVNDSLIETPVVLVTNEANGDYINLDFSDISFGDFWESNHTQLKVSFDIFGLSDFALPIMQITPVYSENAPELSDGNTKLSPLSTSTFSCNTAYGSVNSSVIGTYNTSGVHKFEYVYTKNVAENTLSLMISLDDITETFVYNFSDLDFSLNLIKIQLSNNYSESAAVSVMNLSVGYVPALTAFPGEPISIPTNLTPVTLGNKVNPLYNIYNHNTFGSVNEAKNIITIQEEIPSGAYVAVYIKDDYKSINVFDYDYLTVEFDVSILDGETPVSFMAYLLGRPNGSVKQYVDSNVWFYVDGDNIYGLNTEKTHMTAPGDEVHVRYVIQVDSENETAALQVFFNDVLYYNASETFNSTYNCIEELRLKHFGNAGAISVTNLLVNGYII